MRIVTLMEDSTMDIKMKTQNGLSIYIETKKQKILFDLGLDGKFIKNAEHMGINIADIDTVIISHGHKGHAGGLKAFLEVNDKAKIYMKESALTPHFLKVLGISKNISSNDIDKKNSRIIFTKDFQQIDSELYVFTGVNNTNDNMLNKSLYIEKDNALVNDDFNDEQYLIIKSEGKTVLVTACAHKGIVNAIDESKKISGKTPDYVFSGLHFYDNILHKYAAESLIASVGEKLNEGNTKYYTYHCIGKKPFKILKEKLGDKLKYMPLSCDFPI